MIAPRSCRDRAVIAPNAAHSYAAVRRLLGTCDQDGRHTFERDGLRDKIDAMLSKSVHSPSCPCPRPCPSSPTGGERLPGARLPVGTADRRPVGADDPTVGADILRHTSFVAYMMSGRSCAK